MPARSEAGQRYRAEGIPIRYLQLDSWWYYKTLTDPDGTTGKPKNERLPLEEWIATAAPQYQAHPSCSRRSGGISAAGGAAPHRATIAGSIPRARISNVTASPGSRHSTGLVARDHRLPVHPHRS